MKITSQISFNISFFNNTNRLIDTKGQINLFKLSVIIDAKIMGITFMIETGLEFDIILFIPDLKIGITYADFQIFGKYSSHKDLFNTILR